MVEWNVTINLFFIRTSDRTTKEEPNPSKKQIDEYMRKGTKYKELLADMYLYDEYGKMPTKIKYMNGGKLSYTLSADEALFPTKESVISNILENSFEDGMYGAQPGSHGVYPTKKQYVVYGSHKAYEELGLIDCRKRASITVKKSVAKNKKKASVK